LIDTELGAEGVRKGYEHVANAALELWLSYFASTAMLFASLTRQCYCRRLGTELRNRLVNSPDR